VRCVSTRRRLDDSPAWCQASLCVVGLPTTRVANAQSSSSFLIKPSLQSKILMADSIPSTKVCRKCKEEKPADQFIWKTKSSITRGRPTANCLDCRNRQASLASKRTAEQAELSPIRREGLPLIDLQLRTQLTHKNLFCWEHQLPRQHEQARRLLPDQVPRLLLKKAYDLERRSNLRYRVVLFGRDQPGGDIPAHPSWNVEISSFRILTGCVICRIARGLIKIRSSCRSSGRSWKRTEWNTALAIRKHGLIWA
ncbi:hypothetical protein B0J13DRAFT_663565, partial [Dactylonectria estremocensis]